MERTWKPTAAGILCIIGGTIGAVVGLITLSLIWIAGGMWDFLWKIASEPNQEIPAGPSLEAGIVIAVLIVVTIAIVGDHKYADQMPDPVGAERGPAPPGVAIPLLWQPD